MRNSKLIVITRRLLTPDKIPGINIAAWFSTMESGSVILDGTTASQWSDISGNNRHATQATKANQPTYTPDGLNGKPSLSFDGLDDFLSSSGWSGLISGLSGLTVSTVIRGTSGTLINTAGNNGSQFSIESGGAFWINNTAPVNIPYTSSADIQNYTFDAGIRQAHRNGTLLQQTTATPNIINTNIDSTIEIGRRSWFPQFLDANISELLLIRSALSTASRQQIEGYFAWRWGTADNLANNHPFKFSPPYI
jgi:hypothetical protein